jgi:hypothetical protein
MEDEEQVRISRMMHQKENKMIQHKRKSQEQQRTKRKLNTN